MCAAAVLAATLAACVQSTGVPERTGYYATRQADPELRRTAALPMRRHIAVLPRKHTPFPVRREATAKAATEKNPKVGVASFYAHDVATASGEAFNPQELTAAHRTLPFGTRLRVTNVETGQSVTVRVNDRGPFIPGRIVDVSSSAAESLGITERGIAKVKVDVVQ